MKLQTHVFNVFIIIDTNLLALLDHSFRPWGPRLCQRRSNSHPSPLLRLRRCPWSDSCSTCCILRRSTARRSRSGRPIRAEQSGKALRWRVLQARNQSDSIGPLAVRTYSSRIRIGRWIRSRQHRTSLRRRFLQTRAQGRTIGQFSLWSYHRWIWTWRTIRTG